MSMEFEKMVKCNQCMEILHENEIVYDSDEDKECCPYCGKSGCLMEYNKGFNEFAFIEWMEDKYNLNPFSIDMLYNIIEYAHKREHVSKNQFAQFLADMIPEITFDDVARYCEDGTLKD